MANLGMSSENRVELNSCYYLLLFSVMMRRFWTGVGFVGLR
jgi:hypothetical protein